MAGAHSFQFESNDKYLKKFDQSLSGRVFKLAMDDGEEYELRFVTGEIVEWSAADTPLRWEKYGCLKADDTTFFVVSELAGTAFRTCVTLVLDTEQSLVTLAVSKLGTVPGRPRLATVDIRFGAIRTPGQPLPYKRHGFTAELVGRKITWYYANGFVNTHIYQNEKYYRIRTVKKADTDPPASVEALETLAKNNKRVEELLFEEPARYVKIKKDIYLLSFVEENINKVDNLRGGNNMIILINADKGFDCARTFSLNAEQKPEGGMFIAYGEFIDEDIPQEHLKSPYRV